jgi:hypothetical protein
MGVTKVSRVTLPRFVGRSFEVYVNGVRQQPGTDFVREGDELVFSRSLAKEGKLGFWRWTSLFLGIAGTYRQNDSVDVVYDVDGRRVVATALPITPDETGEEPVDPDPPRTEEDRPSGV